MATEQDYLNAIGYPTRRRVSFQPPDETPGSVVIDNGTARVIPQSVEQQAMDDLAVAYETAMARRRNPRLLGAGINLDSEAALDKELYAPIRRQYGLNEPASVASPQPKLFEIGNKVVAIEPNTGQQKVLYEAPPTMPKERMFKIPLELDPLGNVTQSQMMTKAEAKDALPRLSDDIRHSATVRALFPELFDESSGKGLPTVTTNRITLRKIRD